MIYFLKDEHERVKIGYSKDLITLFKRLTIIRVGNADRLKLVALYEGTMEDEQTLHSWYTNIRGEWFEWENGMMNLGNNLMEEMPSLNEKYNKAEGQDRLYRDKI